MHLNNHPGKVTSGKRVGHVFRNDVEASNKQKKTKVDDETKKPGSSSTNKKTDLNTNDKVFNQLTTTSGYQRSPNGTLNPNRRPENAELNTDDEANELIAGYGLQRGPRGGLIPKRRPDVEARNAEKEQDPTVKILRRGSKNRKNKRKQSRDIALKEFATSELESV